LTQLRAAHEIKRFASFVLPDEYDKPSTTHICQWTWRGNVFGDIRKGIDWLEQHAGTAALK